MVVQYNQISNLEGKEVMVDVMRFRENNECRMLRDFGLIYSLYIDFLVKLRGQTLDQTSPKV